eukprot:CAMPEP_0197175446 /NCGR_PEP_ID=MMETSP1423-20130617/1661_1 /TAXON_ID=476441 /ORGANISM="Pseudo-nitzschia heimii, Strain UNC1101" /LENGTH=738 /DNA_ID=CAMNT_0042624609 /DNA_START=146 /DNA_END=2362 /DNA_ORIENTATION=+
MGGTTELSKGKRQLLLLFPFAAVLPVLLAVSSTILARIPVAGGFVPAAMRRAGGFSRRLPSFVGPPTMKNRALTMSPTTSPESDDIEKKSENRSNVEDDDDYENIVLHQRIKEADPEWYREYVSELLGEDYCIDRWPAIDISLLGPKDEAEIEKVDATTIVLEKSGNIPEEPILPQPATTEENDEGLIVNYDKIEEDDSEFREEDGEVTKSQSDTIVKEDGQKNAEFDVVREEEKKTKNVAVKNNEIGEDESIPSDSGDSSSQIVQETIESLSVEDKIEAMKSITETEQASAKTEMEENDVGVAVGAEMERTRADLDAVAHEDPRVVVYRNITGQAMTCVPLADLLELGYTVSNLERIQAEFLSIVVLDSRRCPTMGVPPQWKIKNPRDEAEITLVDSMEEATALVNQINKEERTKRDSTSERRRRQELRQRRSMDQRRGAPPTGVGSEMDIDADSSRRLRRRGTDRDIDRAVRRPEARRRPGRGAPGRPLDDNEELQGQRRANYRRDEAPVPGRDRRRRQRDRNYDGKPRKIYRAPRDDTRRRNDGNPDPPDPDSPIWVNMDTFRDLLQKEADFRLNILGDDWSDIIGEENDWRTGLYKSWLWSLNNGVGESIVPPSRYERARRSQRRRMSQEPPQSRPRTRPSQESSFSEGRRRRQRGGGPPSLEIRSPPRDVEPRPRRQRQSRRSRRGSPGTEDNFNSNNDDDDADIPVSDAPDSAAQRRLRRRAERRLRAPPDN